MTIKDIARLAGCGVSTVSRALNGSSEISDATRARINEVIQKYNYTPNGNARRMRQTAPNSVLPPLQELQHRQVQLGHRNSARRPR